MRAWLHLGLLLALTTMALADEAKNAATLANREVLRSIVSKRMTNVLDERADDLEPQLQTMIADLKRTLKLPKERVHQLEIAAEGVMEHALDKSRKQAVDTMLNSVKSLDTKAAQRAVNGNAPEMELSSARTDPRWQAALKNLLSEEELKRWQDVVKGRESYQADALARYVLHLAIPVAKLTKEQVELLQPKITHVIQDYMPDMLAWGGNGLDDSIENLYLGYLQMTLRGIPEDEARKIIKPDQWQPWLQAAGRNADQWKFLESQHEQRVGKKNNRRVYLNIAR